MNTTFLAVQFDTTGHDQEILIALLSVWPFESFHQEGDILIGYIPEVHWDTALQHFLSAIQDHRFLQYTVHDVPNQNWNAVWESSFDPVSIGQYCHIRAAFHPLSSIPFTHEIIIAPKMAFGTGHHATTAMMIEAMQGLPIKGKHVLDFGCGTGILSVLAAMSEAAGVLGVDIQPEAIENSIEHAQLNHVERLCVFLEGGLDKAGDGPFDIILANINSKTIFQYIDGIDSLLFQDGWLLLSGIMTDEVSQIMELPAIQQYALIGENVRHDWAQLTFKKYSASA